MRTDPLGLQVRLQHVVPADRIYTVKEDGIGFYHVRPNKFQAVEITVLEGATPGWQVRRACARPPVPAAACL